MVAFRARTAFASLSLLVVSASALAAPSNDACDQAIAITFDQGSLAGTTTRATTDGSASCGGATDGPDVWYSFTTHQPGTLHLSTCASPLRTILSVHADCPGTPANELLCRHEGSCPALCGALFGSCLSLSLSENATYWIRVSGDMGRSGDFNLHVQFDPAPAPTGDFNADGTADGRDLQGFIEAILAGSTRFTDLAAGNFNGDGRIDEADTPGMVDRILRT